MIAWSRKTALIAGIGLILVTNAVALGGAAYNRRGSPESSLPLSERELLPAVGWGLNRENSGMKLMLRWRTLADEPGSANAYLMNYGDHGGRPKWLDRKKLAALGFDTSPRKILADRRNERVPTKQALLVLELNGATYQAALERARKLAAKANAENAEHTGTKELEQKTTNARAQFAREENEYSRLFVVDAGLDAETLRLQYPDRTRYAIVPGQVQATWNGNSASAAELVCNFSGTSVDQINVPLAFHSLLTPEVLPMQSSAYVQLPPGEITVAFGRRLEPWIVSVSRR